MASLGNWPASIVPSSCRLPFNTNQRANAAPGGGSEQVVDMLNERWTMDLTLPRDNFEDAAAVEAFLNSFRGMVNTVSAWPFHRPQPRGTLRGSLFTVGTTAQGASSITLQARRGRVNLLTYSEQFNHADWIKSNGGVASVPVVTADNAAAPDGTMTAEKVDFALNGGTTSTDLSALQPLSSVTTVVGQPYAVYLKTADGSTKSVRFDFNGTAPTTGTPALTVTGSWQRFSITLAAAADTTRRPVLRLRGGLGTSDSASLHVWGFQFETGALSAYQRIADAATYDVADYAYASATLKAGDFIGVGGQLLMVATDATADSTGSIAVQLVNRVRAAIAASAVATWDKPSIAFRKLSDTGVLFRQGLTDEIGLTLGEVIA